MTMTAEKALSELTSRPENAPSSAAVLLNDQIRCRTRLEASPTLGAAQYDPAITVLQSHLPHRNPTMLCTNLAEVAPVPRADEARTMNPDHCVLAIHTNINDRPGYLAHAYRRSCR